MFVNRNLTGLSSGLHVHSGIKAGDPGTGAGGGAGGGGTGGGGAGGGSGGNEQFGGLSQEAMDAIEARMTTMLQGGLSSVAKRQEKQFGEKFDELKKMFEKSATPPAEEEGGKRGKRGGDDTDNVTFATMQQKLATQQEMLETIRRERDEERRKNKTAALRQMSTMSLQNLGITDPISQDMAITSLIAKGILGYESDDSDRIVWRTPDGSTFDAEQGFRQWARGPEAQRLFPATGTRGSGGTKGNGQNGRAEPLDEKALEARAWGLLKDADFSR